MIVMHMSGVYEPQNFYSHKDTVIDCRDISGTNCYCDDIAKEQLRERIARVPVEDIHFLDSGNYHYLSLLWLEKVQQRFSLVLFDHHPDMQSPSFGEITSCGGWVKETLENNPYLQNVYLVGVDKGLMANVRMDSRVQIGLDKLELEQNPVYISFDKDVLWEADARCDWDQGDMTLEEAMDCLHRISAECRILGMDVCGEDSGWENTPDSTHVIEINNTTNRSLAKFWQNKK